MFFIFLAAIALFAVPIVKRKAAAEGSRDPWIREFVGLLLVFTSYLTAWSFGLPAMLTLGNEVMRIIFQVVYILASSLLGVFLFLFFAVFSKQIRNHWLDKAQRLCRRKITAVYEVQENTIARVGSSKEHIYSNTQALADAGLDEMPMKQMTCSPGLPDTIAKETELSNVEEMCEGMDNGSSASEEKVDEAMMHDMDGSISEEEVDEADGEDVKSDLGEKVNLELPSRF